MLSECVTPALPATRQRGASVPPGKSFSFGFVGHPPVSAFLKLTLNQGATHSYSHPLQKKECVR